MEKKQDYTGGKRFWKWFVTETPIAFVFLTFMLVLGTWYWYVDSDRAPLIVTSLFYLGYLGAAWNNWKDLKGGIRK